MEYASGGRPSDWSVKVCNFVSLGFCSGFDSPRIAAVPNISIALFPTTPTTTVLFALATSLGPAAYQLLQHCKPETLMAQTRTPAMMSPHGVNPMPTLRSGPAISDEETSTKQALRRTLIASLWAPHDTLPRHRDLLQLRQHATGDIGALRRLSRPCEYHPGDMIATVRPSHFAATAGDDLKAQNPGFQTDRSAEDGSLAVNLSLQ